MSVVTRRAFCAAAATLLGACASTPAAPSAAARAEMAPTGPLRAAINFGNTLLARRGRGGKAQGVSVDLAEEVAWRLGVPLAPVLFSSAAPVVYALQAGQVDLAFLAIDPARAADMAFTAPYLRIEGAYLVPQASPLQRNEEVDRAGIRVAVGQGSTYDLHLSRTLKAAALVRAPTSPVVADVMLAEGLEAAAGVRQQLEADARRLAGVRVLPGRFLLIEQALCLPKGRPEGLAWLAACIEELKASGFVAATLQRHGVAA